MVFDKLRSHHDSAIVNFGIGGSLQIKTIAHDRITLIIGSVEFAVAEIHFRVSFHKLSHHILLLLLVRRWFTHLFLTL